VELTSHLGRAVDPAYPSNRQILRLSGALLAAAGLAGLLRPIHDDGPERALLAALRADEHSRYGRMYRWATRALMAPFANPSLQIRVLRGYNALLSVAVVFTGWAQAREVLPDQPELATPAAALIALQPAVWQLATSADPRALEVLCSTGMILTICRIASRTTGMSPTTRDYCLTAVGAACGELIAPELWPLPWLLALANGYDALRAGDWRRALLGAGTASAGAVPALLQRWRGGRSAPKMVQLQARPRASQRALQLVTIGGLLGMAVALALDGPAVVRSEADTGEPLATEAVQLARGLAIGWAALRLAQGDDRAALDALAPLSIGAVAGVAALAQRISGGGG
jgi:hypothetical protein